MKHSRECMSETFFMSNMSPQRPEFNRGIWRELEELVRRWVREDKELHVVAGPVLAGKDFPVIGSNRVAVPDFYYKVILDYREPGIKAIGFILPNGKADARLWEFAVPVDRVEELTGIDFYPALPDDVEELLESSLDFSGWPLPGRILQDDGPSVQTDQGKDGTGICSFWLTIKTGVRHNSACRHFGKSRPGKCCGPDEGRACGICGG
jgi:endonuclease G